MIKNAKLKLIAMSLLVALTVVFATVGSPAVVTASAAENPTLPEEEHKAPTTPTEPTPYDGVPVTPKQITSANYRTFGLTDDNWSQYNGYYAICDAKELYGFAELCKTLPVEVVTKKNVMGVVVNAVLLSDIVINTSVDPSSDPYFWTPIGIDGDKEKMFAGVFDGNGYSISGFYQDYTGAKVQHGGMFASIGCATVKNLVIKNSAFYAGVYGGAVISDYMNASVIEGIRIDESVTLFADGASSGFAELEYITGAYDYAPLAKNVYVGTKVSGGAESMTGIISAEVHSSSYYENVYYKPGDLRPFANIYTTEREGSYASISKSSDAHVCAPIVHNQVNGTCYRSGLSAYTFCAVCEKILSGEKTVLYGHGTDEVFYAPNKTDSGRHDERCLECTELFGSADHRFNGRFDITCEDCDFSIFTLNPSGTTYILSCENYTLTHELHLSKSVTIPEGATLTVSEGITFTMGESISNRGTIINNGGIKVSTDYYGSGTVICGENAIYHPKFNDDGFCIFCENEKYPEEPPYSDGYYEISKIGHLMWFSNFVSAGNTSANARLTADIVFNEGDLSGLNGQTDGYRLWVPIGMTMNHDTGIDSFVQYTGTFDGDGHTISGLYHFDYWSYGGNAGLFSRLGVGGVIKNVTVKDSYFATSSYVGAILGENLGGTVENCHNVNTTIASAARAGGIVGNITKGTVKNCTNSGTVKFFMVNPDLAFYFDAFGGIAGNTAGILEYCTNNGNITGATMSTVGGISGQIYQGIVRNNVNNGNITVTESGTNFGGITGYQYHGTISYNINYGTVTAPGNLVGGVIGNPLGNGGVYTHNYTINGAACGVTSKDGCFAITSQELADGRLAFELGIGQEIGVDARPYVGGPAVYAYFDESGSVKYTNNANYTCHHKGGTATCDAQAVCDGCRKPYGEIPEGAHEFKITGREDMHYCLVCGGRCGVVAPHSTNYIDYCAVCGDWIPPELAEDGFYEIDTFGNLMWFANQVNAGNYALNARLVSNITAKASYRTYQWVPIGGSSVDDTSVGYEGIFDGQGYTIALFPQDMLVEGDAVLGLFGTLKSGAVVKNLSISNRIERTFNSNGPNYTYSGEHTVYFGIVAGRVLEGAIVSGCRVANGSISISNGVLGGIVGINYGTVENCVSYGMTLTGPSGRVGGIVGDYNGGTVINSYTTHPSIGSTAAGYVGTSVSSEAGISDERMASGEIAHKMNSYVDDIDFWYQAVGNGGPVTKSEYSNIGKIVYMQDFGIITIYSNTENKFTISADLEISSGETLTIPKGVTLVIAQDVTLTNYGILVKNGSITGDGALDGFGDFIITEIDPDWLPVIEDKVYDGESYTNEVVLAVSSAFSAFGKTFTPEGFTLYKNFTEVKDAGYYEIGYIREGESHLVSFVINAASVAEGDVSLEYTSALYNGQLHEPLVSLSGFDIVLGKDYYVTYEKNTSAGEASMTITFRGNFSGSFVKNFTIAPVVLGSSAVVEITESVSFTGSALEPVSVWVGDVALVRDVHYTVTYENNIYPGTASAVVRGIGDVSGEQNFTFTIEKVSFTVTVFDQIFPYNDDFNVRPYDHTMYEGVGLINGHTVVLGSPEDSYNTQEITVMQILDAEGVDVTDGYDLNVTTGRYHMFYNTYRVDNDGNHYRMCVYLCDEKGDFEPHHGGTQTCVDNAVCVDCGRIYLWATNQHIYDNGVCTEGCGMESGYVVIVDEDGNYQHSGTEIGHSSEYVHLLFHSPDKQYIVIKDFEGDFAGVGLEDTSMVLDFYGHTINMSGGPYGLVLQAENLDVTFKSSATKGGTLIGYTALALESVTLTLDNVSHSGALSNYGVIRLVNGSVLNSEIINDGTIYLPEGYDLSSFTSYEGNGIIYVGDFPIVYNAETKTFECAFDHSWVDADCTTAKYCNACGKIDGEPLGHDTNGPATCETDEYCSRCDTVINEKLGHSPETLEAVDPSCEDAGCTEGSWCPICGTTLVAQEEISALGHDYEAVVTESTCTTYGYTTYTCIACGDSYVSDIVMHTGHNEVVYEGVEPTCTEGGFTDGIICGACGEIIIERDTIDPLGHSFVGENCVAAVECTVCGEESQLLDHIPDENGICQNGCESRVIAQIGTKMYTTLYNAVANLTSGDVLVILADISSDEVITIPAGVKIQGDIYTVNVDYIYNYGIIENGNFSCNINFQNYGIINGGSYRTSVANMEGGTILGGTFYGVLENKEGALVSGGTFEERFLNYGEVENRAENPLVFGEMSVYSNMGGTILCENHVSEESATCNTLPRCTLCKESFGEYLEHIDTAPVDHICDICGEVVSVCEDDDSNGHCDLCGEDLNPDPTPDNDESEEKPLSAGAIAGIVAGSTTVAGAGGFSLVWFAIKKKSGEELINLIKAGGSKVASIFKKK